MSKQRQISSRRVGAGFSLIEVLIALVVLAVGLLGLALLQTMNLRYTQSAQQRTQAVNLASELLDMMRANDTEAKTYQAITQGSFAGVSAEGGCGTDTTSLAPFVNMQRWRCEVKERLGSEASANVIVTDDKLVTVAVAWNDEFWKPDNQKTLNSGAITLETQL